MSTNKPAEFNFYLNTQGPRGRQGAQGPQGVSPTITIGQNNANSFTLVITDANGTFETPNLKGNLVDVSDNGSYVRYQPSDGTLYTSDLEQATTSTFGGVRFATEDNLLDDISSGVVISPSDLQDYLAAKLTAGENISITKDDETGIVTISTTGSGSGGVSSYNDLTDKPELFGTVIQNDNTLSHYVPLKAPLKETVGVDYEQDIVIENGTLADGLLTFANDWHPMFVDSYSSFTLQGEFTLNGNEFTPSSYASMPINVGDIIGFPGGTGADIACGHIRESDGQFIFTHLLRVDGLTGAGDQSTENWCNLHITNKTASGSTLQCSAENGTSTWLTGKSITNGACYFQFRQDTDGSYIVVFIRQNTDGNTYGIKTVFSSNSAKADLAQLSRVFFGGTDVLQNPQNQFFIYRNPGINLEDITSQSDFNDLTNMVNWQFPDAEHSLYIDYDDNTIKVNEQGKLYANFDVSDLQKKFTPMEPLSFNTVTQSDLVNTTYDGDGTYSTSVSGLDNDYTRNNILEMVKYDTSKQDTSQPAHFFPVSCAYFPFSQNIGFNSQVSFRAVLLGTRNSDGSFTPRIGIGDCAFPSSKTTVCVCARYDVDSFVISGKRLDLRAGIAYTNTDSINAVVASYTSAEFTSDKFYRIAQIIKNTSSGLYELVFIGVLATDNSTANGYYSKVVSLSAEDTAAISACDTVCVISSTKNWSHGSYGKAADLTGINLKDYVNATAKEKYDLLSNLKVPVASTATETLYLQAQTASTSNVGISKPDGTTITITDDGTISAIQPEPYTLPAATTTSLGGVKPDGTTITVTSDGTISSVGGGSGGTTDYTALTNKPQINSVELTGNKSLTDIGAQAITDNTLTTTAKTIVGAINELVTRISALETQVTNLNTVVDGQTGGSTNA